MILNPLGDVKVDTLRFLVSFVVALYSKDQRRNSKDSSVPPNPHAPTFPQQLKL